MPDEVETLRQMMLLERQRSDRKMNLMPRPPLLGEVASSVSEDDGEVVPEDDLPDVPDATGCSGRGYPSTNLTNNHLFEFA